MFGVSSVVDPVKFSPDLVRIRSESCSPGHSGSGPDPSVKLGQEESTVIDKFNLIMHH